MTLINWFNIPAKCRPRIEMLTSCFGWSIGDRFTIQMEDQDGLYFDDIFKRWTIIERTDENIEFKYIRQGDASKLPIDKTSEI